MDQDLDFTILRHVVPRGADGLSSLQTHILAEPLPVRIFSAPTSAGKSYAFIRGAQQGQRILFAVPTRRLAQNLARDARKLLDQSGQPSRVAVWSSDETAALRQRDATVRVAPLRVRQADGFEGRQIDFVVATPESIAAMLLHTTRGGHGDEPFNIAKLVTRFDHIVFDEFHSIDARGFGLYALIALACAATPGAARTTFLSATPIDVLPVLTALGLDAAQVAQGGETVVTTTERDTQRLRALHGDVHVSFVPHSDMVGLVEQHANLVRDCLAAGRQVVIILDSRDELFAAKDRFATLFDRLGVPATRRLAIDSIDDNTWRPSPDGRFVSDRAAEPTDFLVLLATSSVEMGVTFNAGLIVMDAGHDALSFVQRIGRVARGDEDGRILVRLDAAKLARADWLRQTIRALRVEPAPRHLTIDRFLDIVLAAIRERFTVREPLTGDNVPPTFRSMSLRAVWAASVFWRALERKQVGVGQREALWSIRPNQVRRIAALLDAVAAPGNGQKPGLAWVEAFLNEAGTLREIGATSVVIEPDGTRHDKVPLRSIGSYPSLFAAPIIPDPAGGDGLALLIDRRLEDIMGGEPRVYAKLTRPALLPNGIIRQVNEREAATDTIRAMRQEMQRAGVSERTERRLQAAVDLVRCSGLVPAPCQADAMVQPAAAAVIL